MKRLIFFLMIFYLYCNEGNSQALRFSYPFQNDLGKYSLIDSSGKALLPYEYDLITEAYFFSGEDGMFNYNYNYPSLYFTKKNDLWGLADEYAGIWLECRYNDIKLLYADTQIVPVLFDGTLKRGYYLRDPNFASDCVYDNIIAVMHRGKCYLELTRGDAKGLTDLKGDVCLPVGYYSTGISLLGFNNYLYFGDRITCPVLPAVTPLPEYIPDQEIDRYFLKGVYNLDKKKWMIEPGKYSVSVGENLILLKKDDKYAIYQGPDKEPEFRFSQYEEVTLFINDEPASYYIFDQQYILTGHFLSGPYEVIDNSNHQYGFITLKSGDKWGMIGIKEGAMAIPCIFESPMVYESYYGFYEQDVPAFLTRIHNCDVKVDTRGRIIYDITSGKTVTENNRMGYAWVSHENGSEIITVPCEYENLQPFMPDRYEWDILLAQKNGKLGLVNTRNEILLPIEQKVVYTAMDMMERTAIWYTGQDGLKSILLPDARRSIGPGLVSYTYKELSGYEGTDPGFLIFAKNIRGKYEIWNYNGTRSNPVEYDKIYVSDCEDWFGKTMFNAKKDGKLALLDINGNELTKCLYERIDIMDTESSNDIYFFLTSRDGKLGVINSKGKVVLGNRYDKVENCYHEFDKGILFKIQQNGKWGVADTNDHEIIPPQLDSFDDLYAWIAVSKDKLYGYIDDSMQIAIPFKYEYADNLAYDYDKVKYKGKYGVINKNDRFIIQPEFEDIYSCDIEYHLVKQNGLWGIQDSSGKWIKKPEYTAIDQPWHDKTLFAVMKNKNWGVVNYATGEEICPFIYDGINCSAITLYAVVLKGKKMGAIDSKGKEIIPCDYDFLSDYISEDLILAARNKKYGFVDERNNVKIPFQYENGNDMDNKYAVMKKNGKWGLIDNTGKEISPFEYDEIIERRNEYMIAVKKGKRGLVKLNGEEVFPFIYDILYAVGDEYKYRIKKEEGYLKIQ